MAQPKRLPPARAVEQPRTVDAFAQQVRVAVYCSDADPDGDFDNVDMDVR